MCMYNYSYNCYICIYELFIVTIRIQRKGNENYKFGI